MYLQVLRVWGVFLDWGRLGEVWMPVHVVYLEGEKNTGSTDGVLPSSSPPWAAGALLFWDYGRQCRASASVDPSRGCRSWVIDTSPLVGPWLRAKGGHRHLFLIPCLPCGPLSEPEAQLYGQRDAATTGLARVAASPETSLGTWMGAGGAWCRQGCVATYLTVQP